MNDYKKANSWTVIKLIGLAVSMFVFALWVMPPLYTLLCEVTGLRKVGGAYEAVESTVDTSRTVTVKFVATHNDQMPWEFRPQNFEVKVHSRNKIEAAGCLSVALTRTNIL